MRPARALALASLLALAAFAPRAAVAAVHEDEPCAGCVTVVPDHASEAGPRPLLVALHGDGGGVRPLVRAWRRAAEEAGVILLAPRCPRELGCRAGSFWQWLATSSHDPAWLGAQIAAVEARYPIDPARVFATGYSGGATYLGWYGPAHAARFGAIAYVAGGVRYGGACPACKVPVRFVLGATDPMIEPYTRPLHAWYAGCEGHENGWELLRGVTHESILSVLEQGKAKELLAWLLARPGRCAAGGKAEGGAEPSKVDPGPGIGAIEPSKVDPAGPGIGAIEPSKVDVGPPRVAPGAPGCACETGARGGGSRIGATVLAALAALAMAARRSTSVRARGAIEPSKVDLGPGNRGDRALQG